MLKKLICVIISVIMGGAVLSGCSLIEHNEEKDAQQVIVTIGSIVQKNDKGEVVFTSTPKTIYKYDLIRLLNSDGQNYMSQNNATLEQTVDAFVQQLIVQELLYIEAERLAAMGILEWTQKQQNQYNELIYNSIDSQLQSIMNGVHTDFNEKVPESTEEEKKETTYPIKPSEETEEDYTYYQYDSSGNVIYLKDASGNFVLDRKGEKVPDYIKWAPGEDRYPAMHGTDLQQSLEREAVNRFVSSLKNEYVKDDFKATAEDKKKFAEADKQIADAKAKGGVHAIYPMLGGTYYMEYLVGASARRSIQLSQLQEYITEEVNVTEEEILEAYGDLVYEQKAAYDANESAFETAIKDGKTNVLYNKTSNVFFVKHILLPFSDAQKAEMEAYKAKPENAGKDYTVMRDSQMVSEMVVYAHKDGEDDKSVTYSADEVLSEINAAMEIVKGNPKAAERVFDDFIYKYNTDPGIFDNARGYAVSYKGENSYMKEFTEAAIELRENQSVGTLLNKMVVTDYGVHIMYFANQVSGGTINALNSYQTPGEYKTYKEIFEDQIQTTKENDAFEKWKNERIVYYESKADTITKYEKRFKDLKEAK